MRLWAYSPGDKVRVIGDTTVRTVLYIYFSYDGRVCYGGQHWGGYEVHELEPV